MKNPKRVLFFFIFFKFLLAVKSQNEKVVVRGNLAIKGETSTNEFNCPSITLSNKLMIEKTIIASNLISSKGDTKRLYIDKLVPLNGVLDIYGDLILSDPVFVQTLEAPSIKHNDIALWQLTQHENFENNTSQGWDFSEISSCENNIIYPNKFIGGPCKLSNQEIEKTFENLPNHEFLKISAKFHMFDNWQGEYGYMKINNKIMWTKNAIVRNETGSINICGQGTPDPAYNIPIDVTIPHTDDRIKITFGSSLSKDSCLASYGVDDIMIYVK